MPLRLLETSFFLPLFSTTIDFSASCQRIGSPVISYILATDVYTRFFLLGIRIPLYIVFVRVPLNAPKARSSHRTDINMKQGMCSRNNV